MVEKTKTDEEGQIAALTREVAQLKASLHLAAMALEEAAALIHEWGVYANTYFQEKYSLSGDIARIKAQAEKAREALK